MIWPFNNRPVSTCGLFLLLCIFGSNAFADQGKIVHHGRQTSERMNADNQDHGGGETGGLAALLFGVANLPVVLSMLLKASAKLIQDRISLSDRIRTINLRQKKYLMNLHYWINPLAFGVATFHFMSSECRSTAIPELGMGAMLFVFILGLMMTFKLSPPLMRRFVFRLHTSPIITILVFSFLLIGHSVID
jgi:hypothetical protein